MTKNHKKLQFHKGRLAKAIFFVKKFHSPGDLVEISGSDAKHIKRVLRLSENDKVNLFDNKGYEYTAKIVSISSSNIETEIIDRRKNLRTTKTEIILGLCIPKLTKMDLIIQKCVEIGVTCIVPLTSARTIIKNPSHSSIETRYKRWSKIAYEAVKQCGRGNLPTIEKPCAFEEYFNYAQTSTSNNNLSSEDQVKNEYSANEKIFRYLLSSDIKDQSFKKVLECKEPKKSKNGQNVSISPRIKIFLLVGPEGGLTVDEKKMAVEKGFEPVKISSNILRVETAAIMGVGLAIHAFEPM